MHKQEIEAVDARIGIKFQDAGKTAKGYGVPRFKIDNLVVTGRRYISIEDCQMLRKVIHGYMAFANEFPCDHFIWSYEANSAEFSDLGKRLIACIDLYQKQILNLGSEAGVELSWNSDIYAESANVRIFRKVLVQAANEIRKKRRSEYEYLSNIQLRPDEVGVLQKSMQGALALMNRPRPRRLNKRLYDEMYDTNRSIQSYLTEIKNTYSEFGVLPLILSLSNEKKLTLSKELPDLNILPWVPFPTNYLDHFKLVSGFVSALKKVLNKEIIGHLVKLTGTNATDPQCVLLLFISQDVYTSIALLKLQINYVWADCLFGHRGEGFRSLNFAPGIKIDPLIEISKNSKSLDIVSNLVENVFIQELRYQHLRLPARRRFWSKSIYLSVK